MAKKNIDFSGLLNSMNEKAKEEMKVVSENEKIRTEAQKAEREEEVAKALEDAKEAEKEAEKAKKEKPVTISRKEARPIQKTVHLTEELNSKVNLMKAMMIAKGQKTTFEDILFDRLQEWVDENFVRMMSEM